MLEQRGHGLEYLGPDTRVASHEGVEADGHCRSDPGLGHGEGLLGKVQGGARSRGRAEVRVLGHLEEPALLVLEQGNLESLRIVGPAVCTATEARVDSVKRLSPLELVVEAGHCGEDTFAEGRVLVDAEFELRAVSGGRDDLADGEVAPIDDDLGAGLGRSRGKADQRLPGIVGGSDECVLGRRWHYHTDE